MTRHKRIVPLLFLFTGIAFADSVYVVSAGITGNGVFGTVDLTTGSYKPRWSNGTGRLLRNGKRTERRSLLFKLCGPARLDQSCIGRVHENRGDWTTALPRALADVRS